ncbi:hypothetical protein NBRC10512_007162 [Rhodotorula toruloides]|uniref:Purple acid phosphatase n=2 Tax=Rhodotorula toruloides TaxID=5286 RepID=A0A061AKF3_RHOTO|nr:acid phosphatase [Rhodotorula toruloides NP11]EMS21715.1 acid phosphatase [Rhodotorula toruloides NP11]KAJ8292317.1 Acid phosphatase [Rhodotorula toruloides]CDR35798.1 RHTO0S01e07338g1_1 [Rhodotorula toruloides]
MLPVVLSAVAAASLFSAGQALSPSTKDVGNGVHVPGAIPANLNEPLQHRLAFAGPTGMTVSWSTFNQLSNPQVFYGTDPSNLDQQASSSESTTYPTSRTYNNHVKLTGLKPGTKYYYKVSYTNAPAAAYRPTYSFTTARAPGDTTPYSIAIFGDLGLMGDDGLSTKTGPIGGDNYTVIPDGAMNTIQSLLAAKDSYDFIYHTGDIAYNDYFLKESIQGYFGLAANDTQPTRGEVAEQYESLGEQFYDQMQPITAERPWLVTPGNHEANCDNGGVKDKAAHITYDSTYCMPGQTNFTGYNAHFKMPSYESGGVGNMWYSFDNGLVHYVSLTCETDLGDGLKGPIEDVNGPFGAPNQQINWLKNDLANVDRTKTPWVVVGLHRPWYTSSSPPTWPAWQQAFEKIFYDNHVDVYHQGHVHTYEFFSPMMNGTVDPNGLNNPRAPLPVLNGASGHYDGLDQFDQTPLYTGTLHALDTEYGWGRLTFHNKTHLTYQFIASRNGSVIDEHTLYKEHNFRKVQGQHPYTPPSNSQGGNNNQQRRNLLHF